jgi:hypothetical protein
LRTTNVALRAERDGSGWKLTSPVSYPAHAFAIEVLLDGLGKLTRGTEISAADIRRQTNGLAGFGLDPAMFTLKVYLETNTLELRFGSLSPLGSKLYFQPGGSNGVMTADTNFFNRLPRNANDWRNPSLLHLADGSFNRVELRAGGRGFEVERDTNSTRWKIAKPMTTRADNPKLENLFQQFRQWQVGAFVTDDAKVDLETLGLQTPEAEMIFSQGTNVVQTIQFGKVPTVTNATQTNLTNFVYARRLSHTNVVLVHKAAMERLRVPFSEYRDRRVATFEPTAVDTLEVRAEDNFTLRRDPDGAWRVTEPLNFAADAAVVRDLVLSLGALDVLDFVKDVVTDFSAYGLAKPLRQYALKSTVTNASGLVTNVLLAHIDLGTNAGDRVYVRRADEDSVYTVPLGSVLRLPQSLYQVRDRRIWNFASSNVTAVTAREGDRTMAFTRDAKGEWTNGDQSAPNLLAVEETLHRLGEMRATQWVARGADKKAVYGFAATGRRLEIEVAGGERPQKLTLEVGALSPRRQAYAAVQLEGETVIFEMPADVFDLLTYAFKLPAKN